MSPFYNGGIRMIENNRLDELMNLLENAYKENNVKEINRIDSLIMEGLEVSITESSLDYEFIESIKNKAVYKNLVKHLNEDIGINKHDTLKFLSSMVTHLIIESEVRRKDLNNYPIKLFLDMIQRVSNEGGNIRDVKEFLQNRYGRFV
jgi:hypothetical protein